MEKFALAFVFLCVSVKSHQLNAEENLPAHAIEISLLMQVDDQFVDTFHVQQWIQNGIFDPSKQLNRILAYLVFAKELGLSEQKINVLSRYSRLKWAQEQETLHAYISRRYGVDRWGAFENDDEYNQIIARFSSVLGRARIRIIDEESFKRYFGEWNPDRFVRSFVQIGFK